MKPQAILAQTCLLSIFVGLGSSCSSSQVIGPLRAERWPAPNLVLVWHGYGESYRVQDNQAVRTPTQDYEFTVVQRRYDDVWESTKEIHRRHPKYDGIAGPRDQTMHFSVSIKDNDNKVVLDVNSTLGNGHGKADKEFRVSSLRMKANVSSWAPFDTYTIEQKYLYEEGRLEETVKLLQASEADKEIFIIQEKAQLYARRSFNQAPTKHPNN